MRQTRIVTLIVGLMLLAPGGAGAAEPLQYTAQSLIKLGDTIGAAGTRISGFFEVGTLNDNGQLIFVTVSASGSDLLVQYDSGKSVPIINPGDPAPFGTWPNYGIDDGSVPMNAKGNTAVAVRRVGSHDYLGTFLWEAKTRQFTPLALPGMAAVGDLTFNTQASDRARAAINNSDEVAFPARVRDASGRVLGEGIFLRGRDGKLQAVALPGRQGADGVPISSANQATINDAGRVAFLARRSGDSRWSGYVWESGSLTPVAVLGAEIPGGTIAEVLGAWVNNRNRNVLVEAVLNHVHTGPHALYLWNQGTLTPVVLPGQEMPGGGRFTSLHELLVLASKSVSFPNDLGQHAFYGWVLEGNKSRSHAYLMEADGRLAPILKSGASTAVGTITNVGDRSGYGIGLNNKGQVAVGATVAGTPPMILLLTPVTP